VKKGARPYLFAGAAVLAWSTVASAFKLTLRHLSFLQMLFWAALFSTAALFLLLIAQGRLRELRFCSLRDCLSSAVMGLLNPFLYYFVLFQAYDLLPAQLAQPLNYTWAIALPLLSVPLLGQRLRPTALVALLVSFAGVVALSTRGDPFGYRFDNFYGVALAVGSSLVWALYWIRNVKDEREDVSKLALNFAFGLAFIALYALLAQPAALFTLPPFEGLAGAAYIGLFEMGLTFVLWLTALRLASSAAQVANLVFLSPFLSLLLIHVLVGERILPSSVAGLALIVLGILIQRRAQRS